MKDIHEVLRRKQAQYAELGKQIEALQGAAETLKSVASLLTDEDSSNRAMPEFEAPAPAARAAAASASPGSRRRVRRHTRHRWRIRILA